MPINKKTGQHYDGSNIDTLDAIKAQKGYSDHLWATFLQWRDMGYSVKKGERGVKLARYGTIQKIDAKTGKAKQSGYMRAFVVFNIEQVHKIA